MSVFGAVMTRFSRHKVLMLGLPQSAHARHRSLTRMNSSSPVDVTTQTDMHRYAQTLFGNCTKENLLAGSPYDGIPVCFLIRVKGACNDGNSKIWPDLFDEAYKATVETHGRADTNPSNAHDSGVSLAQRRQHTARTTEVCGARGQHCSAT